MNEQTQTEQRPPLAATAAVQAQLVCRIKRGIIIPRSIPVIKKKKGKGEKKMEAKGGQFASADVLEAAFIAPAVFGGYHHPSEPNIWRPSLMCKTAGDVPRVGGVSWAGEEKINK